MKTYRPLQISLNNRALEQNGKFYLVVSESIGFSLKTGSTLLEFDVAKEMYPEMGEKPLPDMGMPKPQGEFLVSGSFFAPGNVPVTGGEVRAVLGDRDKSLYVFGNRKWRHDMPSEPEALSELKLEYCNAFGGDKEPKNPDGKGYRDDTLPNIEYPDRLITSGSDRPEPAGFAPIDPSWPQRMKFSGTYDSSYREKYFPGYPDDFDWRYFMAAPQDQWAEEYYRGDEAYALYNMHPEKPCVRGNLPDLVARCFCLHSIGGAEPRFVELPMNLDTVWFFPKIMIGLLIWRTVLEVDDDEAAKVSHLLAAYERRSDPSRTHEYYRTALDRRNNSDDSLLNNFKTEDLIAVNDKCAMELLQEYALGGDDTPSEFSKNLEAKEATVKAQLDEQMENAKEQLKEKTEDIEHLSPEAKKAIDEILDPSAPEPQGITDPDQIALNAALENVIPGITGGDPSKIALKDFSFDKIDKVFNEIDAFTDKKMAQADKMMKEATESQAVSIDNIKFPDDFPEDVREELKKNMEILSNPTAAADTPVALPRINSDQFTQATTLLSSESANMMQQLAAMKSAGVSDEVISDLEKQFDTMMNAGNISEEFEKAALDFRELYGPVAHYLNDGLSPHKEKVEQVAETFLEKVKNGESVANGDWACIDLSNRILDGIDLSGCFLEQVDFTDASLKGANFTDAIMCRARLENADLSGSDFTRCNIGAVHAKNASFGSSNMRDAILTRGNFTGANLSGCNLKDAEMRETELTGADLSDAEIPKALFIDTSITGVKFKNTRMPRAVFAQSRCTDLDFSGADLANSVWAETSLERVCFDNAAMTQACFAGTNPEAMPLEECSFNGATLDKANFQNMRMKNAALRKASAENANFASADLSGADLSGMQATGAQFRKAILAGAKLDRINLMNGSLSKARLEDASFEGANLFSVDFLRSNINNTNFNKCNLENTLIEDWKSR